MSAPYDPATHVGWPRPRLSTGVGRVSLPSPYLADLRRSAAGVYQDPAAISSERGDLLYDQWLCQVCGAGVDEDLGYAPVPSHRAGPGPVLVSGGPLCSLRCTDLATSVCPHFAGGAVVVSFARADASWSSDGSTSILVRTYAVLDRD